MKKTAKFPPKFVTYKRVMFVATIGQLPFWGFIWNNIHINLYVFLFSFILVQLGSYSYVYSFFPEKKLNPAVILLFIYPFIIVYFTSILLFIPFISFLFIKTIFYIANFTSFNLFYIKNAVFFISFIISIYATLIRRNIFKLTLINLNLKKLPSAFDGYKIIQLSDLHIGNFISDSKMRYWLKQCEKNNPDLIIITGDIINSGNEFISKSIDFLKRLHAKDGVYIVLGNHDEYVQKEPFFKDELIKNNLSLLDNDGLKIYKESDGIYIAGIADPWTSNPNLDKALAYRTDPSILTVLASHSPTITKDILSSGIDLVLSGHTHGGQIALPFFNRFNISMRVYKYTSGLYKIDNTYLYVSNGLGTTGPPIRLGSAPEIALITLNKEKY